MLNRVPQTIFADDSYPKPYFVTYVNSSFFALFLVWVAVKRYRTSKRQLYSGLPVGSQPTTYVPVADLDDQPYTKVGEDAEVNGHSPPGRLLIDESMMSSGSTEFSQNDSLTVHQTAWLSFEFCLLWFLANYFVAACLEYTTVASSTILTSTSSIWTLIFGAILRVETFTIKKLLGSLTSLAGIILISSVDLTGNNDKNRGDFPHKSHRELAIGDILALASALLYGIYTTLMKKRIGDEGRVDMPLFFGFVGLFNLVTLLPGFFLVHWTGIETFELPPTRRVTMIVLVNSATSLVSDFCWAYSMLLTSPLVVTVGLSLTIPLSLFGQMIVNSQTSSAIYWIGAAVVFVSFVFINHESKDKSDRADDQASDRNCPTGPQALNFAWRIWNRLKS